MKQISLEQDQDWQNYEELLFEEQNPKKRQPYRRNRLKHAEKPLQSKINKTGRKV